MPAFLHINTDRQYPYYRQYSVQGISFKIGKLFLRIIWAILSVTVRLLIIRFDTRVDWKNLTPPSFLIKSDFRSPIFEDKDIINAF